MLKHNGGSTPAVREFPGQSRDQGGREGDLSIYRAMPYLLVAVPPVVMLLTILIASCTMSRIAHDPTNSARFYSDPNSRAGDELVKELDQRAAREDMRRLIEEEQR